jgi:hypothetical protein
VSKAKRKTQSRTLAEAGGPASRGGEGRIGLGSGEFRPDYTHVIRDLKRIGLLAGGLILGLIILSFFFH